MEHRVLSAISVICLVALQMNGCSRVNNVNESVTMHSADSPLFQTTGDTTYYAGKKYNGLVYQLATTGDTLLRAGYRSGVREGVSRKWYDNGQLAEERYYHYGQKQGAQKGWWSSGRKKYEFVAIADHYEGLLREWNQQGLLIKSFHYSNGQESGSQRLWYDDGKTRANYTIKDGRRYGLLGTKNCRNVSDSVFTK